MKSETSSHAEDRLVAVLSELASEVADIKKLLMLSLMNNGSSQAEVARALGVHQATISRLIKSNDRNRS